MSKSTNNTNPTIQQVEKAGDWVLPVKLEDGTISYALQINKSAEEKANLDTILAEYANAGVTVLTYKGKNDKDVFLVKPEEKLRSRRVGVKEAKLVSTLMARGFSEEEARAIAQEAK